MPKPAAVFFDMDGTIVSTERQGHQARTALAAHLGGGLTMPSFEEAVGVSDYHIIRRALRDRERPAATAEIDDAFAWFTQRTALLLSEKLEILPGALELIEELHAAGIPLGLVTSTRWDLAKIVINQIGRIWWDTVVCGDHVGDQSKPHPRPYLLAAQRLGVDPEDCVAIEDSPSGIASAEAAGFRRVIVVPSDLPVGPGPVRVLYESLKQVGLADVEL
ncbi:HAD family hydrolase [Kribbella antibiotica]|uniref:HAD family hydrolase n=1 Tax=Kribbella antibiotica TaxID=190195 RepID=UPI0014050D61|nr:HAD family phosphatase [Kribbella antibiotica]